MIKNGRAVCGMPSAGHRAGADEPYEELLLVAGEVGQAAEDGHGQRQQQRRHRFRVAPRHDDGRPFFRQGAEIHGDERRGQHDERGVAHVVQNPAALLLGHFHACHCRRPPFASRFLPPALAFRARAPGGSACVPHEACAVAAASVLCPAPRVRPPSALRKRCAARRIRWECALLHRARRACVRLQPACAFSLRPVLAPRFPARSQTAFATGDSPSCEAFVTTAGRVLTSR